MDEGAWKSTVRGIAMSWTGLSDFIAQSLFKGWVASR